MLEREITDVRNSVVGVLRIHHVKDKDYQLSIVGSAWCVKQNRYFVTAHHVLNNGNSRDTDDKFEILRAPGNGAKLERVKISKFVFEDQKTDYAIFEINEPEKGVNFPQLPINTDNLPDGTQVMTYGYPSPIITGATMSQSGDLLNIQTAFYSHANEGIVASQYEQGGLLAMEFNVGWHHGESGGPILVLKPLGVICCMKGYRKVQTPDGIVMGPRFGLHISAIAKEISKL
jgi:hypothetical protein